MIDPRSHSSHREYPTNTREYNRHYDSEYLQERDRDWIEHERYQPLAQSSSRARDYSPHRSGGNNRRVLNAMQESWIQGWPQDDDERDVEEELEEDGFEYDEFF